jgi:hypothetical protein
MKALFTGLTLMLLAGCSTDLARYQLVSMPPATVWRMDTWTGEMEACGFEAGKPTCTPFPSPPQRKK